MLKNRTIVCVSTIDWDFLWQQHQAITSIFARHGNRVLFVENTGVRPPGLRDLPRLWRRLRKWTDGAGRFQQVIENVFVFSPLALPLPYSPTAQKLNRALVCRQIRRWLDHHGDCAPILFSFLPTQFTLDLMATIEPSVSVYYCTTNFSESSAPARQIVRTEPTVIARCDLVFASASELLEMCRPHNPNVHLFPIGVSLEKFDAAWNGNGRAPADVASLKPPIAGYVGGLHRFVDQSLIQQLSARLRDVNFVLVGPEQTPLDGLKNLPNVHLLGVKPHEEIPDYIRHFDVCLIPYVLDAFTSSVSPAKLNEYLALGKPVVSSDLPEVRQFNQEHGEVVVTAAGVEDFIARVADALRDDSSQHRAQRREVAQRNAWWHKVEAMSQLIEARLAEKSFSRD
jgi:glycosyltransferase involved in cell wall biosynthesis